MKIFMKKLTLLALFGAVLILLNGCYSAMELHQRAEKNLSEGNTIEAFKDAASAIKRYKVEIKNAIEDKNFVSEKNLKNELFYTYIFIGNLFFNQNDSESGNTNYLNALDYYDVELDGHYNYVWLLIEANSGKKAIEFLKNNKNVFHQGTYERLLAIVNFDVKNLLKAENNFLDSIHSGLPYNKILVNRNEDEIFRNIRTKKIQSDLHDFVDKKVKKQELVFLSNLKNPFAQWVYLKNRVAGDMGEFGLPWNYLNAYKHIYFTKLAIIVTKEDEECVKIWLLGTSCTTKIYAGQVFKGDIVYVSGGYLTTLRNTSDIKSL